VIEWANSHQHLWAIALSNAGAAYTEFRKDLGGLNEIKWEAVQNTDFRSPDVKEGKQAEFLVFQSVPWNLVENVGVCNGNVQRRVQNHLKGFRHQPTIRVQQNWYY
jgi:hypothetical protein